VVGNASPDASSTRFKLNPPSRQQVQGAWVEANLFAMTGVAPQFGRVFTADEENRHEPLVVLSHGLWMRRFAGAADVVGKTILINGWSFQVIGVMPESFQFPARDQMFWASKSSGRAIPLRYLPPAARAIGR